MLRLFGDNMTARYNEEQVYEEVPFQWTTFECIRDTLREKFPVREWYASLIPEKFHPYLVNVPDNADLQFQLATLERRGFVESREPESKKVSRFGEYRKLPGGRKEQNPLELVTGLELAL